MKRAVFGLGLVVFSSFAQPARAGDDDEPPCSSEEKSSSEASEKDSDEDGKKDACRCRDNGVRSISGSLEGGAFASIQFDFVHLEANVMRIDAQKTGDHSPVDLGRAALCGLAGKVGICADMTMFRGTARFGGPPGSLTSHFDQAVATYAGLTVGVASW